MTAMIVKPDMSVSKVLGSGTVVAARDAVNARSAPSRAPHEFGVVTMALLVLVSVPSAYGLLGLKEKTKFLRSSAPMNAT